MSRWFRWYEGTTEDGKFRVVARMSRVTVRDVIALWAFMLEDAANMEHRGVVKRDEDFMAAILDFDEGVVENILSAMQNVGMIKVMPTDIVVNNWDKRQFESDADPTAAERQRRKRGRDKARDTDCGDARVTRDSRPPDTDTETDKVATQPVASRKIEIDRLEAELREAAGQENNPAPSLLDLSPIASLLKAGYDLREDVLPKLRAAKAAGKKPSTWAYYVRAITEGKAANAAIPAKAVAAPPTTATVWLTEDDPRWPEVCDRHQRERGKPLRPSGSRFRPGQGADIPFEWLEPRAA